MSHQNYLDLSVFTVDLLRLHRLFISPMAVIQSLSEVLTRDEY